MGDGDRIVLHRDEAWTRGICLPRPGIAKPDLRQQMKAGDFGATIVDCDPHQRVLRAGLGVFDEDIEVAILVEKPGIDHLELHLQLAAAGIFFDQPRMGNSPCGYL